MMKRMLTALLLAGAVILAHAVPTVDEVQSVVQQGDYDRAATMMQEVVQSKPGSARAHYVYAEILAHQRRIPEAAEQARLARQADPQIRFASRDKFEAFERELQAAQGGGTAARATPSAQPTPGTATDRSQADRAAAARSPSREESSGLPAWVWPVGLVVVVLAAVAMFRRRSAPTYPTTPGSMPAGGTGPYGAPPYAGGPAGRSGAGGALLGAGLGAAGGFAAGMMADRMLHGGDQRESHGADAGAAAAGSDGLVPGAFSSGTSDADQLAQRDVDFGQGAGWDDNQVASADLDIGPSDDDGGW